MTKVCEDLRQEIKSHEDDVFRPAMAQFALKAADELEAHKKGSHKFRETQARLVQEAIQIGKARQKFLTDKLWGAESPCSGWRLLKLQLPAAREAETLQRIIDKAVLR